jgi:hypothetical protein
MTLRATKTLTLLILSGVLYAVGANAQDPTGMRVSSLTLFDSTSPTPKSLGPVMPGARNAPPNVYYQIILEVPAGGQPYVLSANTGGFLGTGNLYFLSANCAGTAWGPYTPGSMSALQAPQVLLVDTTKADLYQALPNTSASLTALSVMRSGGTACTNLKQPQVGTYSQMQWIANLYTTFTPPFNLAVATF